MRHDDRSVQPTGVSKMTSGYCDKILRVNLSTGTTEIERPGEDFFRMYMGGGAIGSYYLLNETEGDLDPLDERNIVTIAPGVTTGARVSGVSRCSVTALSPLTGAVGDGQAGGSIGVAIKRAGYDAVVITGKAPETSFVYVDADTVEIRDGSHLAGKTVLEVYDALIEEVGGAALSILQCGPAGERGVRFACLAADCRDAVGRTGMGAVFGSKNLRALVVRGSGELPMADEDGLKTLRKRAIERIPDSGFPTILKGYGTPGVVGPQAESGNLATHNYTRSFHENYKDLHGETFEPEIGTGSKTCFGCAVACRKKVKANKPFEVTDRLGGPEFETLGLLGSNLDITDPVAVAKANELCNNYGIDTITMGGLAGYVFECVEKGWISPDDLEGRELGFGDAEGLLWLIERTVRREGIGETLSQGFVAALERFGEHTAIAAIHVKNQGFAVHMPQVKPSISLMYAACPIGPDHQSSEHDWLLAGGGEAARGLGILGEGDAASTGLNKVRATVYSQYYYSLLDTLNLCMFCWGPGNLFTYQEVEELLRCTTGWSCTFFELMKVGERRVNMMRQLNARRGFTRERDVLPKRMFEALPDGPTKGRHVEEESFGRMLDQYYALMGWDHETGNPMIGKLLELGLEWTIESS